MATEGDDDVLSALVAAVRANAEAAEQAAGKGAAGTSATYSTAALQLAEAYAWMSAPAQPHGRSPVT